MGFSLGQVLGTAGAVVGGVYGGPPGAVAGYTIGSNIGGMIDSSNSGDKALNAQRDAANNSLALQSQMYDQTRQDLGPYRSAGVQGLQQQMNYLGLRGPEQQQAFINSIIGSPEYGSAVGEANRVGLQNASASGGLRGGNIQAYLGMTGPNALSQMITSRYNQFGGLVAAGQTSAANTGVAGQNYANQSTGIIGGLGNAEAQNALAQATMLNTGLNTMQRDYYGRQ